MRNIRPLSNSDDVIDSRDVIARIDELETDIEDARLEHVAEWQEVEDDEDGENLLTLEAYVAKQLAENMSDEAAELKVLQELADEADGSGDWRYGETLIRDSYFEDYAQQLAEDVCDMKAADSWPFNCIDWAQAARELQHDYTSVEFDGVTYWIRS